MRIKIVELATGEEFYDSILPVIKDLFNSQSAKAVSIMIENLPLMLEKLSEAKKPDDVRNYLLPLLGRALAQEKQSNLQVCLRIVMVRFENLTGGIGYSKNHKTWWNCFMVVLI